MAIAGLSTQGNITGIQTTGGELHPFLDVYSLEALHEAQAVMMYENFANRRLDLTAGPGQTVKFVTYANITRSQDPLTEGNTLSTRSISSSVKSISVTEWGNAISVSEKALQLSFDQLMSESALLLGRDYAITRDLYIRDALVSGFSNTIYGGDVSAQGDVRETHTFGVEEVMNGVLKLQESNVPKFNNDYYVCFVHPRQASYLRRDSQWQNANHYKNDARALFKGEIGRFEDVIFISTTHQGNGAAGTLAAQGANNAEAKIQAKLLQQTAPGYELILDGNATHGLADNTAGGSLDSNGAALDLFRATMFGDQAYALADSLPVELRDNGVEDFGRQHSLAWYSIYGCGVLNETHGVHIITA
jgi:N4-gp56 family major capsid protein